MLAFSGSWWAQQPRRPLLASNTGLGSVPTAAAHAVSLGQTVRLISTGLEGNRTRRCDDGREGDEEWLHATNRQVRS